MRASRMPRQRLLAIIATRMIGDVGIRSRANESTLNMDPCRKLSRTLASRVRTGAISQKRQSGTAVSGPAFRHFAKQLMIPRLEPLCVA